MQKIFFLFLIMAATISCNAVKISHDFDKTANFSSYKTFAFTDNAILMPVDEINKKRVLDAVENELKAKGLTKRENKPDVLIDINVKSKTTQTATVSTTGYPGYGYGYGYGYAWGGGFSTVSINYNSYTDGTIFIDMIDASKKQLVWQGRGTKTIDKNASDQKREANISYAVKQIFMYYPPKF